MMVCHLFDHMCSCSVSNSAASTLFHSIIKSDQIFTCFIIFGLTLEVGVPVCNCGLGFEKKSCFLVDRRTLVSHHTVDFL